MRKLLASLALFLALSGSLSAQQVVRVVSGVATLDVERNSKFKVIVDQNVTSIVIPPPWGCPILQR